jgi:hypothetical protein
VRFSDIKIVSLGDIPPIITTDSADVAAEERAARSSVVAKIVKLLKRDKGSAATSNADSI